MTGTRDTDNHIHRELAPGAGLAQLAGIRVEEFGRLAAPGASGLGMTLAERFPGAYADPAPPPSSSALRKQHFTLGNRLFATGHLYEKLLPEPGTEVLGTWADRWLERTPMATRRVHGKGQVIYLGTYLTPELAEQVVETICIPAGAAPLLPDLPGGVEVSVRQAEGRALWFILNTQADPAHVPSVPKGHDLLSGRAVGGGLDLGPYGCVVIRTE